MKIRVECTHDAIVGSAVFENLLVTRGAETALVCVDDVPAVLAQQLDRGAWQPLIE